MACSVYVNFMYGTSIRFFTTTNVTLLVIYSLIHRILFSVTEACYLGDIVDERLILQSFQYLFHWSLNHLTSWLRLHNIFTLVMNMLMCISNGLIKSTLFFVDFVQCKLLVYGFFLLSDEIVSLAKRYVWLVVRKLWYLRGFVVARVSYVC